VLIGLALVARAIFGGPSYSVSLTGAEIQQALDDRFPIEKTRLLVVTLTLSDPVVEMREDSDRLTVSATATVNLTIPGQARQLGGRATISTGLTYHAADYSFYLADPRLDRLDVQGIPVEHLERVNELAATLLRDRLDRIRVYTLRPDQFAHAAARLVLKRFEVKSGRLEITLGL